MPVAAFEPKFMKIGVLTAALQELTPREKGKVEDRLLELMESLELERSQIGAASAQLKALQERLAAVRAKHETTGARLRQEIADLEAEREARAAGIDRQLLRRYEQIRARQGNLGLVRIAGRSFLPSQCFQMNNPVVLITRI